MQILLIHLSAMLDLLRFPPWSNHELSRYYIIFRYHEKKEIVCKWFIM